MAKGDVTLTILLLSLVFAFQASAAYDLANLSYYDRDVLESQAVRWDGSGGGSGSYGYSANNSYQQFYNLCNQLQIRTQNWCSQWGPKQMRKNRLFVRNLLNVAKGGSMSKHQQSNFLHRVFNRNYTKVVQNKWGSKIEDPKAREVWLDTMVDRYNGNLDVQAVNADADTRSWAMQIYDRGGKKYYTIAYDPKQDSPFVYQGKALELVQRGVFSTKDGSLDNLQVLLQTTGSEAEKNDDPRNAASSLRLSQAGTGFTTSSGTGDTAGMGDVQILGVALK